MEIHHGLALPEVQRKLIPHRFQDLRMRRCRTLTTVASQLPLGAFTLLLQKVKAGPKTQHREMGEEEVGVEEF